MNAYYEHNSIHTSAGNRISAPETHVGDRLISLICAIVAIFTSAVAVKIEKTILSAVCFVGFFGIIGSMERGSISVILGVALCLAATLIEFLIFKSLVQKKSR